MSTEAEDVKPVIRAEEDDQVIDTEESANVWKRPLPEVDEQEAAAARESKKAKVMNDSASKQRGARMFGMLKGTLNKFKEDTKKTGQSEASKRRNAVEARLSAKLRAEQEVSEKKADRARLDKSLRLDVNRKIDEKVLLDNIVSLISLLACFQAEVSG